MPFVTFNNKYVRMITILGHRLSR